MELNEFKKSMNDVMIGLQELDGKLKRSNENYTQQKEMIHELNSIQVDNKKMLNKFNTIMTQTEIMSNKVGDAMKFEVQQLNNSLISQVQSTLNKIETGQLKNELEKLIHDSIKNVNTIDINELTMELQEFDSSIYKVHHSFVKRIDELSDKYSSFTNSVHDFKIMRGTVKIQTILLSVIIGFFIGIIFYKFIP